jgi:acetoacetate decarboxylase
MEVFATMEISCSGGTMVTKGSIGSEPEIVTRSTTPIAAAASDVPSLAPSWQLKLIPRADGPGPALKQLIDGATASQDFAVHTCSRGQGTVELAPSDRCDITCLKPLTCGDAFYIVASYGEGYASIVHDYLSSR